MAFGVVSWLVAESRNIGRLLWRGVFRRYHGYFAGGVTPLHCCLVRIDDGTHEWEVDVDGIVPDDGPFRVPVLDEVDEV